MTHTSKPIKYITCKAEKLVFGGQALAHHEDKTAFLWNALPGEEVEARLLKKHKGIIEAVGENIIKPSADRVEPLEGHFLSCSPWQILNQEAENKYKVEIALETFKKLGGFEPVDLKIISGEVSTGYRNKMEYSFYADEEGITHLALFNRGSHTPTPIKPCVMAGDALNRTALKILDWIRKEKLYRFDLKTLIIRSNRAGETIAGLFVKNEKLSYKELPPLDEELLGFHLFFSTWKSPASVITSVIETKGAASLKEQLLDSKLSFGLMSFFQINVPLFEQTLKVIDKYLEAGDEIVDYYSGVGAISIPLAGKVKKSILVDSNKEAIEYATLNIKSNKLKGYSAKALPAEKIVEEVTADRVIILDPPRAGLHQDLLNRLLLIKPPKIIYLSCNISTQARDVGALLEHYEIVYNELYNYFPRTPHFESLIVLRRKGQ